MTVYQRFADAHGMVNASADGHLYELDVMHEHAPRADQLSYGMVDGQPCVIGVENGRVVVATETGFQWAEPPVVYGRHGSSFRLTAGALQVSHLGRPACAAIEAACSPRVK